jgi:hypothetical protein
MDLNDLEALRIARTLNTSILALSTRGSFRIALSSGQFMMATGSFDGLTPLRLARQATQPLERGTPTILAVDDQRSRVMSWGGPVHLSRPNHRRDIMAVVRSRRQPVGRVFGVSLIVTYLLKA